MSISFIIAGDFVPTLRIENLIRKSDFSFFDNVKTIISNADYSIVNLECPIVNNSNKPIIKNGPNLKASAQAIQALKYVDFRMVTLANNHILDYGEDALTETIEQLNQSDIEFVGAGKNLKYASEIKYINIKNKIIAIINCCEHEYSIATEIKGGANPIDPILQFNQIKEARLRADYVLVITHGGHELYQLPSPRMVQLYRFFIEVGADCVINHHQHCYSGYEIYQNKPIFYGLGNFCFDGKSHINDNWNYGYMVNILLDSSIGFEIIPYKQCGENAEIKLLDSKCFNDKISSLNNIITSSDLLAKEVSEYYHESLKQTLNQLEPWNSISFLRKLRYRFNIPHLMTKKDRVIIGNYINCESHLDKLKFALGVNRNKINER